MLAKRNVRDRNTASNVVRLFMWCALLASTVNGQVQSSPGTQARPVDKARVSDALAKVKTGTQSIRDLEQIAHAGATEAIPDLQHQFAQSPDPDNKAKIAQVLVRFKHSDESYWNSLVQYVTPAVESDTPCPMSFDTKGEAKNELSPEFTAWVESHKLSPEDAL
ncbi:hypothetical protein [Granulicella sp. dw_53]|uniref:hypothetical protein n=1 Tax=Granulicella sp. dw_53 TaxID=2719792 RepID=UPI001BD61FF3|nr:hypothetical protein [Granulicella sp. dw_53]